MQSDRQKKLGGIADFEDRLTHVKNLSTHKIDQAGHMVHHDQPEELGQVIMHFLDRAVVQV